MAYSTPYTFTALELLTAAKMNAIQTNISAIWVGTTAGDTDYYTSSSAKSRLGIGSAYQFMQVNSGATAPEWGGLQFASVYHSTTQNITNATPTALVFDTEIVDAQGWHSTVTNTSRFTIGVTGYYVFSTSFLYSAAGGSGSYHDTVELYKNGVSVFSDRRWNDVNAYSKMFTITFPIISGSATNYFEVYLEQNSGGTRAVQANANFEAWRIA